MIKIQLTGFKPLFKQLEKLTKDRRVPIMRKALVAAAKYVLQWMKALVSRHNRSGTLERSLKHKSRYYKGSGKLVVTVGVQSWFKGVYDGKRVIAHKYAHLLDRGRKETTQQYMVDKGEVFAYGKKGQRKVFIRNRGRAFKLKRTSPAFAGINFVQRAMNLSQHGALSKAAAIIQSELER